MTLHPTPYTLLEYPLLYKIMLPETEQLLATLEVLTDKLNFEVPRENNEFHPINPFIWETATQGEINVFNLMKSQNFCRLSDGEKAIQEWIETEVRGTPIVEDYYAPEADERENILSLEVQTARKAKYQELWQLLSTQLQNLATYEFSCPKSEYVYYIIVGETPDGDWLAISATIPQQTDLKTEEIAHVAEEASFQPTGADTIKLVANIQEIIDSLPGVMIYGYYQGGYNYTYQHNLIVSVAKTQSEALEKAGDGIFVASFQGFYLNYNYLADFLSQQRGLEATEPEIEELYQRYQQLNKFLLEKLTNVTLYRFCFWEWDYIYVLGKVVAGDWVGIETTNEFVYNP